jgi:hypothetical protein
MKMARILVDLDHPEGQVIHRGGGREGPGVGALWQKMLPSGNTSCSHG